MSHTCSRWVTISAKHDDRASVAVRHMNIEQDSDYLPKLGGQFGGDDFSIDVCLDCGNIRGWQPMTDADVKEALNIEDEEEDEAEPGGEELVPLGVGHRVKKNSFNDVCVDCGARDKKLGQPCPVNVLPAASLLRRLEDR